MELTKPEQTELKALLGRLRQETGGSVTVGRLVADWGRLVVEIERGYSSSIYEYMNDMTARVQFELLCRRAGDSLRVELERLVDPWDRRFINATEPAAKPLVAPHLGADMPWWNRVPLIRVGELEADLASMGYAKH